MPATFSINVGTPTESARKQDIYTVLQDIPDNTSKLITPRDVRDAIFSVWANSVFKQTTGTSSIEYIGIDSNNPSNRDIKQKIFIGKRNFGGNDIMNNSLLSSSNETDIFLFNTKSDSTTQSATKISILSGTDSSLYAYAPYIKSEFISDGGVDNIALDIVNPSLFGGPINIYSPSGRISINNIIFPTIAESSASASNGKILRYSGVYPNGSLVWSNDTVSIANIGATGSPTNIFGSPVLINGSPMVFSDDTPLPLPVGGLTQGSTFSDVTIVEMLNRILYPYVPPALSLSLVNSSGTTYSEFGTTASIVLSYSITKYSEDISDAYIDGTTFSGITFSSSPGGILSGTLSGSTHSALIGSKSYVMKVSDDPVWLFASHSATASLNFVYPSFSGFSPVPIYVSPLSGYVASTLIMASSSISSRISIPSPGSQSISIYYSGSGYLFFAMPESYPVFRYAKDPNGYIIHDYADISSSVFFTGTQSNSVPSYLGQYPTIVPTGGGPTYSLAVRFWVTNATCSYPGGNFEFIF